MAESTSNPFPGVPGAWESYASDEGPEDGDVHNSNSLPETNLFPAHHCKRKHRSSDGDHFDRKCLPKQGLGPIQPQPLAGLFGRVPKQACSDSQCHCNIIKQEVQGCHLQIQNLQGEFQKQLKAVKDNYEHHIRSLEMKSFYDCKDLKKYDEAESLYHSIASKINFDVCEVPAIVGVRLSFAEILFERKLLREAEKECRAVWDKAKKRLQSEDTRQTHRLLCRILTALKDFNGAKKLQRKIYERDPEDDWALENGDELSKTLWATGEQENAKNLQQAVWDKRIVRNGPRHHLTIASGLRKIDFLEMLMPMNDEIHGKSIQADIGKDLKRFWDIRLQPGPENSPEILDVGLKLGDIYVSKDEFAEATRLFTDVLAGQQLNWGVSDSRTMSTGIKLGKALMRQENRERYREAAVVFRRVWEAKNSLLKRDDEKTISSATDLASAHSSLDEWAEAEPIYRWIFDRRTKEEVDKGPKYYRACYNLGRALFKQGTGRYNEAEPLLRKVYQEWNTSSPQANSTLECGRMLAEMLFTQIQVLDGKDISEQEATLRRAKASEASSMMREILGRGGEDWFNDKMTYLCSGLTFGQLLIVAEETMEAQDIFEKMWAHPTKTPQEKLIALECGLRYGQSLFQSQKPPPTKEAVKKAKTVVEEVVKDHQANPSNDISASKRLQDHIKEVQDQMEAMNRVERSKMPKPRHLGAHRGRKVYLSATRNVRTLV